MCKDFKDNINNGNMWPLSVHYFKLSFFFFFLKTNPKAPMLYCTYAVKYWWP